MPADGSAREDAVHPGRDVGQPLLIAAFDLGCFPAVVADLAEGLHHGRPVAVSLQERRIEAGIEFFFGLRQAELLDVQLLDPFAENRHPLSRWSVSHGVSAVEGRADAWE